jgi:uncharacterized protein YjiS (DUF1127 family)
MRLELSCIAAFGVPTRGTGLYIRVNGGSISRAESRYKENIMLLSLIRMIQAFRDYQRNVSELSQLSDRELADIGLDRSDIPRVAAGTYNG